MSDEITDKDSNEKQSDLIGVDPLAWLSDEEKAVMTEQKNTAEEPEQDREVHNETSYTIKLNSSLTIRDITDLMEELKHIDDNKNEYVFESADVERVDAAAMQLLTGFYLFAIDAGKKVIWHKPSEAFCNAVKLLGLAEILHLTSLVA